MDRWDLAVELRGDALRPPFYGFERGVRVVSGGGASAGSRDFASSGKTRPSAETVAQVAIMLVIGLAAGAASFTHVQDVAAAHGQGGWLAWADAVVLELMSIASGLELRRRHRIGRSALFPASVMVTAVLMSISAQVVEAEQSPIGWIAAAIPALGFLVMVKIAMAQGGPSGSASTANAAPTVSDSEQAAESETDVEVAPEAFDPVVLALLETARAAAEEMGDRGERLTRGTLLQALRGRGQTVSNARASALVAMVKAEQSEMTWDLRMPRPVADGDLPRSPRPERASADREAARSR